VVGNERFVNLKKTLTPVRNDYKYRTLIYGEI